MTLDSISLTTVHLIRELHFLLKDAVLYSRGFKNLQAHTSTIRTGRESDERARRLQLAMECSAMITSEPRYDDPVSTAAAVELLRRHEAQEPEANITTAIRDFLRATGLARADEIVEENPPSDSSRQAVDLTALDTFLESKQRIGTHGNPHPDHVAQLDGYLKQSENAGRVRMGILTDGKHWLLRWPQAGPVRTVMPYLFTLETGGNWFRLYEWLEKEAFTAQHNIPTDRKSLEQHFGPNAPTIQRDIDALQDLYRLNKDRPTIQVKRLLW